MGSRDSLGIFQHLVPGPGACFFSSLHPHKAPALGLPSSGASVMDALHAGWPPGRGSVASLQLKHSRSC